MREHIPEQAPGLKPSDAGLLPCLEVAAFDSVSSTLRVRLAKAIEAGALQYATYREHRKDARIDLDALFDELAMKSGWRAHRLGPSSLILDAPGLFIFCTGSRKANHCSCFFAIWAESPKHAENVLPTFVDCLGAARISKPPLPIYWPFRDNRNYWHRIELEEMTDDELHFQPYPSANGVADFVRRYLQAPEPVLVLRGPPGTGKTRLIRAVLGAVFRREENPGCVLYTGDARAPESDELFVNFVVGDDDAFVMEAAEHILKPQAGGDGDPRRFLAIADEVVRAQRRKIISSRTCRISAIWTWC